MEEIYHIELDVELLPQEAQKILKRLESQSGLAIKGGVARFSLLAMMAKMGKITNPLRLTAQIIEEKFNDLDVVLVHYKRLVESKDWLLEKEKEIRNSLSDISLVFRGQDVEPVQGTTDQQGCISEETIRKILDSQEGRDLTINEVLLIPKTGQWLLYYTSRCWRDLREGVGMLRPKKRLVRFDAGRTVPTNYGLFRLLKFWVNRKVDKIWLPQWMVDVHLKEANRLQRNPLGNYGVLIAEQYKDASDDAKQRWIKALRALGLTQANSFEEFSQEQRKLLQGNGVPDFEFEGEFSFGEILDKTLESRQQRQEGQQERKQARDQCQHEFQTINCEGCHFKCRIQKCQSCTKTITPVPTHALLCNKTFALGNWKAWEEHSPGSLRDLLK